MQDEKSLYTLCIIGAAVTLGKILASDEKITFRLVVGRVLLGSTLSIAAGAALIQFPDLPTLAVNGLGAALGILGYQAFEVWLQRRVRGSKKQGENHDAE